MEKTKILFLSYNGILEPILPSQSVPYLKGLSKMGYDFILLTYEKKKDLRIHGKKELIAIKERLRQKGIEWRYLKYHKYPPLVSTLFDLFVGMFYTLYIIISKRVRIVHVRGITPGIIMLFLPKSILKARILFDMRGLFAEEYVGGGLMKEDGFTFRLIKIAERRMLKTADAVTVLTRKHLEFNKSQEYLKARKIPMDVIPCCVDLEKFNYEINNGADPDLKKELGLDGKFVLMYPGKIGTFYFMNQMLDFYKEMARIVPDTIFLMVTQDDVNSVLAKARSNGIDEGNIKVVKGVSFEYMPRYVRIADAGIFFINPYKKIGSSPIKMGEFLASGVPVIINRGIGDTEEITRENRVGVVVANFGEADYKAAIRELADLKKEGNDLRARCRETARKYLSVEDGINKYAEIYNRIK